MLMPFLDWQFIAVLVCIALALAVVARRAMRTLRVRGGTASTGCASCGTCASQNASTPADGKRLALVTLEVAPSRVPDASP